jgi:predicted nucleic acid-binding protein
VTPVHSFYLDASGLAKRYSPEPGTPLINYLFANVSPNRFWIFNVGMGELVSLLVRKKNSGLITAAQLNQALIDFETEIVMSATLHRITAGDDLIRTSLDLIRVHSINATDAIILRSALDTATTLRAGGDDLVLVASDLRLLRAAQAEGLLTFNPETQSLADLNALL